MPSNHSGDTALPRRLAGLVYQLSAWAGRGCAWPGMPDQELLLGVSCSLPPLRSPQHRWLPGLVQSGSRKEPALRVRLLWPTLSNTA